MARFYIPNLATFEWQKSVKDKDLATPPSSPVASDRYLLPNSGLTGAWLGQENKIAQYSGTAWEFFTINNGGQVLVEDETKIYQVATVVTVGGDFISSFPATNYHSGTPAPLGIGVASDGSLWMSDFAIPATIFHVSRTGTLLSSFPTTNFDALSIRPGGITIDPSDGSIWLGDNDSDKIYNISTTGSLISSFSSTTFDASALQPRCAAVDPSDNTLWITDTGTDKIYNITKAGVFISSFLATSYAPGTLSPADVEVDSNGTLWVMHTNLNECYNVTKAGVFIQKFSTNANAPGNNFPTALGLDPDGTIWFCNNQDDVIYNLTLQGTGQSWSIKKDQNTFDDKTVDPTVNDDISLGYTVGSRWINTVTNQEFICLDNTDGVAVWNSSTQRFDFGLNNILINS